MADSRPPIYPRRLPVPGPELKALFQAEKIVLSDHKYGNKGADLSKKLKKVLRFL
jgi:hypothetical protein